MTQRPDPTTARDTGGGFEPHSEGQFSMICVDVVNLGTNVEQFPGSDPREVDKVALVFASGETQGVENELTLVTVEMTNSMNEKANLRKFLESWRGKSYTAQQAEAGSHSTNSRAKWGCFPSSTSLRSGVAISPRSAPSRRCQRRWSRPTLWCWKATSDRSFWKTRRSNIPTPWRGIARRRSGRWMMTFRLATTRATRMMICRSEMSGGVLGCSITDFTVGAPDRVHSPACPPNPAHRRTR